MGVGESSTENAEFLRQRGNSCRVTSRAALQMSREEKDAAKENLTKEGLSANAVKGNDKACKAVRTDTGDKKQVRGVDI